MDEAAGLIGAIEGRRGHAWIRAGLPGPDDRLDKPERRSWQITSAVMMADIR
jgi:hypothetical protein